MNEAEHPYEDILHLPHPESARHPRMSMESRAAQFNPYAALVGFGGVIAEAGRLTDTQAELSDSDKDVIDQQLAAADQLIRSGQQPCVSVTYFIPDSRKDGGAYETFTGEIRRIDRAERALLFRSGQRIPVDSIRSLTFPDADSDNETPAGFP